MSTIEPPLTDAELRYVRAAVKLAASYKTAAGTVVECDREQLLPYIEAAIAALPAPKTTPSKPPSKGPPKPAAKEVVK